MPHIKINDLSMYYESHGQGEPLILIAGFSADHTIWREVIEPLASRYQVIVFDNRGSGQTDVPMGPYSIEAMTNDVVHLCGKLGIAQAHFVGNSMGGFILQTLAYRHPTLVKSAIISHSTSLIQTPFHIHVAAQLELLKSGAPLDALIKSACSWAFSFQFLSKPGMLDALIQMGLDNPYPFSIQGYEGQFAAIANFDSRNWVQKIKVPTLVLASDQDLIFSEASVKALANHIPNAQYYSFLECGHLPQIEYPDKFSRVVQQFISDVHKV